LEIVAVRELGETNSGKEGTDLMGEMKNVADHDDKETPGKTPDKYGLSRFAGPIERPWQEVAGRH